MPVIDRIKRMPTKSEYPEVKRRLLDFAKVAYRFDTFQDYIQAAEYKLGRRLTTPEINFLAREAKTPKGERHNWNYTLGHPRGRYVFERPITNIYSKVAYTDKTDAELAIERGDVEDSKNIFHRKTPKIRSPRMDLRDKRKPKLVDEDISKDEYEKDRDIYSNSSFLTSAIVDSCIAFEDHNIGGSIMPKYLKSSVDEVKDLVRIARRKPFISAALNQLERLGYETKVAKEILRDAVTVGAVRVSGRRVVSADANADNVPERLIPTTKYESQEFGQDLEDGDMSYDDAEHPWDTEVGQKLEDGDMAPSFHTQIAKIESKLEKLASTLESLESKLTREASEEVVESEASTHSDEEDEAKEVEASLDKIDSEKEERIARIRAKIEKARRLRARLAARRKASYGSDVMDIAMGDEPTYRRVRNEIDRNDSEIVRRVREARRARRSRCKTC